MRSYSADTQSCAGSHMPLDTGVHWKWRNPLNLLPAFIVLMLLIALIEIVVV